MIENLLRDLYETWGYSTEELNDIREKFQELANAYYWDGYGERSEEVLGIYSGFSSYGKKEDME